MSTFWSIWIIIITLGSIFACLALLIFTDRNRPKQTDTKTTGHKFDGIEELDNPLPLWWKNMFIFFIIVNLIYLLLYPGLGSFKGIFNWTSTGQYQAELEKGEKEFGAVFKKLVRTEESDYQDYIPLLDLVQKTEAVDAGRRLFMQNCSICHGTDAKGGNGFPNLTNSDWLYGGEIDNIKTTLIYGRVGGMPGWIENLGVEKIDRVIDYIYDLNGRRVNANDSNEGKLVFETNCSVCHGLDAKGSHSIGAPNLTNKIWLYGGSRKALTETLYYGRNGIMPAFINNLGEDKINLLAAYVYSLRFNETE